MKKIIALVIILFSLLSVGCNNIHEYLTEDDGEQYLILPISNSRVHIEEEHSQYVRYIDVDLLRTAEEKISDRISQYPDHYDFYVSTDDGGHLCLCVEVIVKLDPPEVSTDSEFEQRGCGIDHKHEFIRERITR